MGSRSLFSKERSLFHRMLHIHWGLVLLVTATSCIGFAMLYSAAGGDADTWALPQIKRYAVLSGVMFAIALINIHTIFKFAYVPYVVTLLLLVLVETTGNIAMGAQRWISIGGFTLQPSELMKISVVLALARYFHGVHYKDIPRKLYLVVPILMVLVPFGLVLRQPDLGTALILLMVGGAVFFAAGVKLWKFAVVIAGGLTAVPFVWHYLHDYQRQRVLTFMDPESDLLGTGYNLNQSLIAIGSGGFSGKGFMHGSQNLQNFLPEKHTDFIFPIFAEEFGFLGSMGLIALYTMILLTGVLIAIRCRNHFCRLLAIGVTMVFFLHVVINMAMVMGLIPVVGAPLPLLSYGGTIMMTMLVGFGLMMNAHINSHLKMSRNAAG